MASAPENGGRRILSGVAASPGRIAARALVFRPLNLQALEENRLDVPDMSRELARLSLAVDKSKRQLEDLAGNMRTGAGASGLITIVEAQVRMLEDRAFLSRIQLKVESERANIEHVLAREIRAMEKEFGKAGSELLRERFQDIEDAYHRILRNLLEIEHVHAGGLTREAEPFVIVAHNLMPSEVALAGPALLKGIALEGGSVTSHAAIMARSLGIPAAVRIPGLLAAARTGEPVLLDGDAGTLTISPSEKDLRAASPRRPRGAKSVVPCETRDGKRVRLFANAGSLHEVEAAARAGADGIGLFRTEFYYMTLQSPPSVEEETAYYESLVSAVQGKPVVLRLLDVGADKGIPFLNLPGEANPALGRRGIRFLLSEPDLLRQHLAALVRASRRGKTAFLAPFVAGPAEMLRLRGLLSEVASREGEEPARLSLGAMLEVPSAVLDPAPLLSCSDFASAGTNDLVQYLFAADRENSALDAGNAAVHPLVWRLLQNLARQARRLKKDLSVCGEMAGDPLCAPLLVGMGVRSLSMNVSSLGPVREAVRRRTLGEWQQAARRLPAFPDGDAAREFLGKMAGGSS